MNYEIVELKEKIIVGISAKTSNNDPDMVEIIGGLWQKLFGSEGIHDKINNRANTYAIGLYSDYTKDDYVATAGLEVTKPENSELTVKIIPAGKYAKFSVHGDMIKAVQEAWGEIREMKLDRNFTGDFEEYLNDDMDNADIDIYIALK